MEEEPVFVYLIGTAGSGKTRLAHAMKTWLSEHGLDAATVNLDPGAERLPYAPDVDVREWIRLADVMDQHGLGPNGAQVAAADMLAARVKDLEEAIEETPATYYIMDTPGQTELFVFREAGKFLVESSGPRTFVAFLIDPFLARDPSGLVSQLLLSATTQFRFQRPMVNVLSKADLLSGDDLSTLLSWTEDLDRLYDLLVSERATMYAQLNTAALDMLKSFGNSVRVVPTSSESLEGVEQLYTLVQSTFFASEDLTPS
ncbi:MAG: ATP/GTP-binding protein [Methanobacteriota archaeon]